MEFTSLQEDLLAQHQENDRVIREQLVIFDPLSESLKQPAARHLLNKGLLIFLELCCYLLFVGALALTFFMSRVKPFMLLSTLRFQGGYATRLGTGDVELLYWGVVGLIVLIAALFFILARTVRTIRLKNDILNVAGKHINTLVGQHLQRKAAMDIVNQRHFGGLSDNQISTIGMPQPQKNVNNIGNPGY